MKTIIAKNNWLKDSDLRLDASFHLSEGVLATHILKTSKVKCESLKNLTTDVFMGPRFKRYYVSNPDNGVPFMGGSDMQKSSLSGLKLISKKMTKEIQQLYLKKGWILVTRSGTIGQSVFTNEDFEGKTATEDVIRIIADSNKIKAGYLYAYLSSNFGYALLTQSTYGAVIQHIEPHHLNNLPVPLLPDEKQQKIHDLIIDASTYRAEANRLLEDTICLFEDNLPEFNYEKRYITKINNLKNNSFRLNATSLTQYITELYSKLSQNNYSLKSISELSETVFTPNIFKRLRVDNPIYGIPFLSGSDLLTQRPVFKNFLSKKMLNIDDYILRKGWIAIQDSGTIGYVTLITDYLDGVAATNNLIRIIPKNRENNNYYIYGFLKTKIGQALLKSFEYGSVQKHIDNNQLSNLKIPIIDSIFKVVSDNIETMLVNQSKACNNESKAIELIENEISSWQK